MLTESDLRAIYERFGAIVAIAIKRHPNCYAFVRFESQVSAADALISTHRLEVNGRQLKVEFARNSEGALASVEAVSAAEPLAVRRSDSEDRLSDRGEQDSNGATIDHARPETEHHYSDVSRVLVGTFFMH